MAQEDLSHYLDLRLAWRRVKADLPKRVFVRHPFEQHLIDHDEGDWLSRLSRMIAAGEYHSSGIEICDVPKGGGAVRPGAFLRLADATVYAACLGTCLPYIRNTLSWAQYNLDFSYLLPPSDEEESWFVNKFSGWKRFQESTLGHITEDIGFVVFADITGFYENIDLHTLISDLRSAGAPEAIVIHLSYLLNRWSICQGRGIPQGYSPSDLLAKLYLNNVDENLSGSGFQHVRYVDDFRFFCRDLRDARAAILELSSLLRRRGLNLQTAKTEILPPDEARAKIEAISSTLLEIRAEFAAQIEMAIEFGDPYIADRFSEELLNDDLNDLKSAPLEVLRHAYSENFFNNGEKFDRSLFHYLLNELGKAGDACASEHCQMLLESHPQETEPILKYFARVDYVASYDEFFATYLASPHAVYAYQKYQIIEWRLNDDQDPDPRLFSLIRSMAYGNVEPPYLLATCRAFVGKFGMHADFERLQGLYSTLHGELDQCEIICALRKMEQTRRNSFFGRYQQDSPLHRRAVAWAKANSDR